MNIQELSTTFDVLWNNVTSNQAPGLNEYEKSVFLTKAQSQLVNEYFNNRTDGFGGGYDGSQRRQYDFSGLVRTERLFMVNTFKKDRITADEKLDRRSKVYLFPQNYFLAVNEILSDTNWQYSVIPLSYAEYQRVMTKPYNFPPKRAAWRIFTDKKNCNVWEATVDANGFLHTPGIIDSSADFADDNAELTPVTYSFQSSWADKKRNLKVNIRQHDYTEWDADDAVEEPTFDDNGDIMKFKLSDGQYAKIVADGTWSGTLTYAVTLDVYTNYDKVDDEYTITILKEGFKQASDGAILKGEIYDVMNHTDGFVLASAPSKYKMFAETTTVGGSEVLTGLTFTTKVVPIPMAEIIGKFKGDPVYQLRYIRTLTPIILEDLTNYGIDISIDGVTAATECALPAETHQEIVERAVTLAKIAWQGGTSTQAQAASQRRNNDD
jgi:hypothetical protein